MGGACAPPVRGGLRDDAHVLSLRALVALRDLELDLRALGEGLESIALQSAEVDEDVLAPVARA